MRDFKKDSSLISFFYIYKINCKLRAEAKLVLTLPKCSIYCSLKS